MGCLDNNIVIEVYERWRTITEDLEKDSDVILNTFDLKMIALLCEVYLKKYDAGREQNHIIVTEENLKTLKAANIEIKNGKIDSVPYVVLYKLVLNNHKIYNDLVIRIKYLFEIKEFTEENFDFMAELEGELTEFVGGLDIMWCQYKNNLADNTFIGSGMAMDDTWYVNIHAKNFIKELALL